MKRRDAFRGGPVYGYREPSIDVLIKRIIKTVVRLGKAYSAEYSERNPGQKADVRAYEWAGKKVSAGVYIRGVEIQVVYRTEKVGRYGDVTAYANFSCTALVKIYPDKTYDIEPTYRFPKELLKAFEP